MQKTLHSLGSCTQTSHWYRFHRFYLSISPVCDIKARKCFDGPAPWGCCTLARHAGSFDDQPHSDYNGRGHCAYWQSCKAPNQTHRGIKKRKIYAMKQIKIYAEYRDMLPRPRLDWSGTPGLWPIGLSPGSWQTSLDLGSMSRYSAQILIYIL